MKIAVFGLGHAGLPLASVIADAGIEVIGVDKDPQRCNQINHGINPIPEETDLDQLIKKHGGKSLKATTMDFYDEKDVTFFIIIVPVTIDDENNADFFYLSGACKTIGSLLKKGDCVVLETTVPPCTTEIKVKNWLEQESGLKLGDFYLGYSPERIMTGFSISRLKHFNKIIGGVNEESGKKIFDVYKQFIRFPVLVSSSRLAEFAKIAEGCYRFTNIALANELYKIADEIGVDFYEAQIVANHEFCSIHQPSVGVGGHCIPVYPWFLIKQMELLRKNRYTMVLNASNEVNDNMVLFFSKKIIDTCQCINKPLRSIRVCVNGITFRKGVKSVCRSRSIVLINRLISQGVNVYAFDELYDKNEIEQMGLRYLHPTDADVVFNSFILKITTKEEKHENMG